MASPTFRLGGAQALGAGLGLAAGVLTHRRLMKRGAEEGAAAVAAHRTRPGGMPDGVAGLGVDGVESVVVGPQVDHAFTDRGRAAHVVAGDDDAGGHMKKVMIGNHAVSWGVLRSRVEVISAYNITPQTEIVEALSDMVADGSLPAQYIKVESEHSAMAACVGASAAGARAYTATSGQGLALMHEMLHWAVGARTPVVLTNVTRAMAPGWSCCGPKASTCARWVPRRRMNEPQIPDEQRLRAVFRALA